MDYKSFQEARTAKSLAKTAVLDASDNPDDQDEARKRRVDMDFKSWRKQTKSGKTTHQEEVGISSSAKMKEAQKEAALKAKEEAAVKKQKEATKKEEVQVEAKVDTGDDVEREEGRNKRKFGTKGNYGHTLVRRRMHRANRGEKKIRGNKEVNVATGKVGKEIGEAHAAKRGVKEETIDELNRYEKEKGKSTGSASYRSGVNTPRKGTPTKKGGSSDKIIHFAKGLVRGAEGRPTGQTRRSYDARGKETDRKESPKSTVTKRREAIKRAIAFQQDTSGT